ncbi:MAG: protein-glutamate O-methyltransferase CheR [Lachnospiraceae bacterium]|nr:protein-glutamate O-methyltransferase CheR [Lachnospiraceae bacterium]
MEYSYEQFKKEIYRMTDIDLDSYKEKQMKRRIDSLLSSKGMKDYYEFLRLLKNDPKVLEEFIEYITINVSEFFRNPEQWAYLEKEVLPKLCVKNDLKIWSAACSTGDEPYTVSMIMKKKYPENHFLLMATDIDEKAISMAKAGEYSKKSIVNVPAEYKEFFTLTEQGKYAVSKDVKKTVNFRKHNLFKDVYPKNVDLLICRNVLIYFTEEKKEEIFRKFYQSLSKGGVLFLGNTEQVIDYRLIGYERIAPFFYTKP